MSFNPWVWTNLESPLVAAARTPSEPQPGTLEQATNLKMLTHGPVMSWLLVLAFAYMQLG